MDAVRRLEVLQNEWEGCTKCELSQHRIDTNGHFVFGEGALRGILFVGEGPGKEEEIEGRPFVGRSGKVLRVVLEKLGMTDMYITNIVACRSCSPLLDQATNLPVTQRNRKTRLPEVIWKDEPPSPIHINACAPRLYEEIYSVDPVVIVSLGAKAAEALTGGAVTITTERGKEREITIPGMTYRAVTTEKKGVWLRKVRGQLVAPVERNEVSYLLVPTLHPAYVNRKLSDKGATSPFRQFFADIKKAMKIYERHQLEIGADSFIVENVSDDQIERYQLELEEDQYEHE
jgi:uracil-DNA glycosylase